MSKQPTRLGPRRITTLKSRLLDPSAPAGLTAFVATDEDVPEMMALSRAAFGDAAMTRIDFSFYLHRAHALVFGLKQDGAVICYCVIELNTRQYRIYVVETCTTSALRGHGHGFWMRARVDDIAQHLGYRHITSHVSVTNTPALKLNEKAGLAIVRRVPQYYDDGRDAFYLRKTLPRR